MADAFDPRKLAQIPRWLDHDGNTLFLLDASSALERQLLRAWVDWAQPPGRDTGAVSTASIPRTRRRRAGDWKVNPRLRVRLRSGDPQLAPLRVVWMPKERDGERSVAWTDLLKLGDPRDPDWLRQHWLLRRHPDRVAIVMGEPAPASALRERWLAARDTSDESSFTEYVSLRGALSLERAERQLRGSRYKVPMFVRQHILTRRSVVTSLAQFADEKGSSLTEIAIEASGYLREIAAKHSPYLIDLVAHATRALIRKAYGEELHYDRTELRRLYELGQKHTLVFLPSHKSHLDRARPAARSLRERAAPQPHRGWHQLEFLPGRTDCAGHRRLFHQAQLQGQPAL